MHQFNEFELEQAHNCWAKACAQTIHVLDAKIQPVDDYFKNMQQLMQSKAKAVCYANGGDRLMHYVLESTTDRREGAVLLLRAKEGFIVCRLHYAYTTVDGRSTGMRFMMLPFNDVADACLADLLYDNIVYPVTTAVDDYRAAGWSEIWF